MAGWHDNGKSLASVAAALAIAGGLLVVLDNDDAPSAAARATRLVAIASLRPLLRVPPSFLGISTEYRTLPLLERRGGVLARVLRLLSVPGEGPLVLRIGGDSADHAFWHPTAGPAWMFRLTPGWLARTRALVRATGIRVILDLNLVTGTAAGAARWARAAISGLPRRSVAGFEIGNEPDIYSRRDWLARTAGRAESAITLPRTLSARRYDTRFRAYAAALARVAPGVPLLGPSLAKPASSRGWVRSLLAGPHPGLGAVSAHVYPFTACARPGWRSYPTIARLLGWRGSAGIAQAVAPAARIAHRAGLPLRLTELNSVTCGGLAGVSDTFATALWAPGALFALLRSGIDGADVHVRAGTVNAAFAIDRGGLQARPLLYGLILFARTLGPGGELVRVPVAALPAARLNVGAVRQADGELEALIVNHGPRAAAVVLRLAASGTATVQRLLAPTVGARAGVTLAGQHLGRAGRWHGADALRTVQPGAGGYALAVPRFSAALVSIPASRAPR